MAADRQLGRSLPIAALGGFAISLALFIVPLVHFIAIPVAPAIGAVVASNLLGDSPRRLGLAITLTLLWELPVAIFAILKLAGAGFVAGWPGGAIAAIAIGVAIWAFSLALAGSLVAARVNAYSRGRLRRRGGGTGPDPMKFPC
ncbi:MAG: hypothetical protein QF719_04475 [Chloroflexota bacterium]|jgi:hypothetical protein|nr:hypothetical protein [Chloroflexota bacterium]